MTLFFLFLISILPLLDLLHPGLPITHDGQDHVARIANFYQSLSEGNIIPRWAANLNWGYGHPILMFLYPLPSYAASFFHAIGFSFVDSTKMVFAVSFVASVLAMYVWVSSAWGKRAGIAAAILYGFAPYRFVDLYVRGAIGEHVAFIFPPIICYGLLRRSFLLVSFGTAFLILSHNALSLMFLPLVVLYALYLRKNLAVSFMGLIFGFFLSAFYWIPAFFEGKYTLRDIVTAGQFTDRFVPWLSFLYSPWSYGGGNELTKWLGAGQILTVLISFSVIEKTSKYQRFLIVSLLLLFLTLFIMTQNASIIWNTMTILHTFQFPWRFMSVVVFLIAVIGGLSVLDLKKALIVCVVSILATVPMWRAKEYQQYTEDFFTGIYNSTTDTGESSPIWSVRFMEKRPEKLAYLLPENGEVTLGRRTSTEREYQVRVETQSRFVENTLYFPGWQVVINDALLSPDKLLFQDPAYRGLMTFDLDPGTYHIQFLFKETKLRRVADGISLVALLGTIPVTWFKRRYH